MKNKGFTLIELLGVIVILAVILTLVAPNIINAVKDTTGELNKLTKKLIYSATDDLMSDNKNMFAKTNGSIYCVGIDDIVKSGYITSEDLKNVDISKNMSVKITYNNGYSYDIVKGSECLDDKKTDIVYSITYTNIIDNNYPKFIKRGENILVDFGEYAKEITSVKIDEEETDDYEYTNGVLSISNILGNVEIVGVKDNPYSGWLTELPSEVTEDKYEIVSRKEYRSRTKTTTTTYYYYKDTTGSYSKTKPSGCYKVNTKTVTDYATVYKFIRYTNSTGAMQSYKAGYTQNGMTTSASYYNEVYAYSYPSAAQNFGNGWCRYALANYTIYATSNNKSSVAITKNQNYYYSSCTKPTTMSIASGSHTEYQCVTRTYTTSSSSSLSGYTKYDTKTNTTYGTWSNWTTKSATASSTLDVETRTVYKYRLK